MRGLSPLPERARAGAVDGQYEPVERVGGGTRPPISRMPRLCPWAIRRSRPPQRRHTPPFHWPAAVARGGGQSAHWLQSRPADAGCHP
ncbi:hypothetical protein T492DRAFT_28727 [Pavlovales sp. CCMP2436]|nr:hypothetical protein T492DRAFT_28727 [Pavlovales sp. CCMP2436]